MRWNSENGVPRGSKNGSGAIIRMCMRSGPIAAGRGHGTYMLHYAARTGPTPVPFRMTDRDSTPPARSTARRAWLVAIKVLVSTVLLTALLTQVDLGRLWRDTRTASLPWLAVALTLYLAQTLVATWRWRILLTAQQVPVSFQRLANSFLVATFFNNFLPSNIGGDVVRITDTARDAGSKTIATMVVLIDRLIGVLGLVAVAAGGATLVARGSDALGPVGPGMLWLALFAGLAISAPVVMVPDGAARLLRPLRAFRREWVDDRITTLTAALARFRAAPTSLVACFAGAIVVQSTIVAFYVAVAWALRIPIPAAHLAILIPVSFIVQMLPVSVNGFGVRETTFGFYFARLGLPLESALALSFVGAVLIMLFSTLGAVAYLSRARAAKPAR